MSKDIADKPDRTVKATCIVVMACAVVVAVSFVLDGVRGFRQDARVRQARRSLNFSATSTDAASGDVVRSLEELGEVEAVDIVDAVKALNALSEISARDTNLKLVAYRDYVDAATNRVYQIYGDANALFEVAGSLLSLYSIPDPATTNLLWSMSQYHTHSAADITSGTLDAARIPGLAASKITSGTLAIARGGTGIATSTGRNQVFALSSASGTSAAAPGFRALVAADLPTIPAAKLDNTDSTATDTIKWATGVLTVTVTDGGTLAGSSTDWPNGETVAVTLNPAGSYTASSELVAVDFTSWPTTTASLLVTRVGSSFYCRSLVPVGSRSAGEAEPRKRRGLW